MNNEKKLLFNPDGDDFTVTYDINGDGKPLSYTIHAYQMAYFDAPIADHIANHLANRMVMKRNIKTNYQADFQKALTEILQHEHGGTDTESD